MKKKKNMDKNQMIVLKSIINFGNKNINIKIKVAHHFEQNHRQIEIIKTLY